jgi:ribosomal protein S18 acetylase RimI-like enzyme
LKIREMTHDDIPTAVDITDKEGWGYSEDDFSVMMELAPHGCFVGEIDEERVGMLTTINYGETAWIGNVVIRSDHRRTKLGSELVNHAVSYLKGKAVKTVGLYSYLDSISFYERIGFHQSFRVGRYSGMAVAARYRGSKIQEGKNLMEIVEADKKYFPGDRSNILGISANTHPDLFLWTGNSGVQGYITGFCSTKACEIGPWICDPERPDLAEDLLLDCFNALGEKGTSVAIPLENKKAIKIVEEHGLAKDFEVVAMFYETDESGMNLDGVFGVGSLEMG